jgi:DNA-binding NarL/FixJ family response regulator
LLAKEPDLTVVGEAADGQVAIGMTRELTPDVVLMDISMPVLNGIEATRAIHAEFPAVRVIGLSMGEDPDQPEAMRRAGAVGYLRKSDATEALLAAIRGGRTPAA